MNSEPDFFWSRVAFGVGLVVCFALAFAKAHGRETRRAAAKAINVEAMIEAIADVESGNRSDGPPGRLGELGRCQFLRSTWAELTNAPFQVAAIDCDLTRRVERAHFARICAQLLRKGHQLEPALIAAAWRAGSGRAGLFVRSDAARRAANVYFDQPHRRAKPLPR